MIRLFLSRKIEKARKKRKQAQDALERATQRRNTQQVHRARRAVKEATHDLMRLEMRAG